VLKQGAVRAISGLAEVPWVLSTGAARVRSLQCS